MAQQVEQALNLVLIAVTLASAGGWIWILRRRITTGRPLVPPRPQREPFWSLAEFIICFGLLLVCSEAAIRTIGTRPAADSSAEVTAAQADGLPRTIDGVIQSALAMAVVNLLVLASMLVLMGLTRLNYLRRYGFWPSGDDLRLGLIASLFILPPVLAMALVLNLIIEYEHPVLQTVQSQPTLAVFLAMGFTAVIVAPLCEEFVYRALLQGGSQKLARKLARERQAMSDGQEPPESSELVAAEEIASWSWWPVVISSVPFALMHVGQGAAPIALFFFAMALGYLYRQTGRLWPCIVVHFSLNAFSMLAFGLQLLTEKSAG